MKRKMEKGCCCLIGATKHPTPLRYRKDDTRLVFLANELLVVYYLPVITYHHDTEAVTLLASELAPMQPCWFEF